MSNHIQTLDKSRKIDDPRFWAENEVMRQPDFDLDAFQKKLDLVCGKTREGFSIVRVVWAWDTARAFSLFFTDWDIEGKPLKSELRAKYIYRTVEIGKGDTVDIPPPRFIFEEFIHPEQYYAAWERNRWQYDPKLNRKVPLRPEPPKDGYYRFCYTVAMHDPGDACCVRAQASGEECFGIYRLPAQVDLDYFARLTGKLTRLKNRRNPYQPFDEHVMQSILADTEAREREDYEKKLIKEDDDRREFASIIAAPVAYSLPSASAGEKRTPGGIILP